MSGSASFSSTARSPVTGTGEECLAELVEIMALTDPSSTGTAVATDNCDEAVAIDVEEDAELVVILALIVPNAPAGRIGIRHDIVCHEADVGGGIPVHTDGVVVLLTTLEIPVFQVRIFHKLSNGLFAFSVEGTKN